jgi:hypothetical protein
MVLGSPHHRGQFGQPGQEGKVLVALECFVRGALGRGVMGLAAVGAWEGTQYCCDWVGAFAPAATVKP